MELPGPSRVFAAIFGLGWILALAGCAGAPNPAMETAVHSPSTAPEFVEARLGLSAFRAHLMCSELFGLAGARARLLVFVDFRSPA